MGNLSPTRPPSRSCGAARDRETSASPDPAALAHGLPSVRLAGFKPAVKGDRNGPVRSGDVDTGARTWAVIIAGSVAALGRALEQAASVSPPERTFVVVTARRPGGLQALPPGRAHVLVEPLDRGSAASILFPVHWIHARDPEATVVVFGDDPPRIAPGFGHRDRPGHPATRSRSSCSGSLRMWVSPSAASSCPVSASTRP